MSKNDITPKSVNFLGSFDYAFHNTLGYEGEYSYDSDDRGGETKYGITKTVFLQALSDSLFTSDTGLVKDLTVDQAKIIYRTYYWDKLKLNELRHPLIAGEIFDTAVNMGRKAATLICQRSLNFLGEDLDEDGVMGKNTMNALLKWEIKDTRALFVCLNGFQFQRYVAIVEGNSSQYKFARGWTKRVQSYQT
jgi:lysozyme family protein